MAIKTKIRALPFGYQIVLGEIVLNEDEAQEIHHIFAAYMQGSSFQKIATDLSSRKIMYLPHKCNWNKNRVKRVLENEKYIGLNDLPPIISKEQYSAVQNLIKSKTSDYRQTPDELIKIQGKIKCSECGSDLKRYLTHQRDAFICKSSDCKTSITLRVLKSKAVKLIEIIKNTENLCPNLAIPISDEEIAYLQNDFKAELSREILDEAKAKTIIYALALAEYQRTDSGANDIIAAEIKAQIIANQDNPLQTLIEISKYLTVDKHKNLGAVLKTGRHIC